MIAALSTVTSVLFVITAGLTAGLFWAFSYSVMRALAEVDDRTFVTVMNKINIAILNPWFGFCFGGGLMFGVLAVIMNAISGSRGLLAMIIALACYLAAVIITAAVNVPLNNDLAEVDPGTDDAGRVAAGRRRFESRWVRWNHVRAAVHTLALAVGCTALLIG